MHNSADKGGRRGVHYAAAAAVLLLLAGTVLTVLGFQGTTTTITSYPLAATAPQPPSPAVDMAQSWLETVGRDRVEKGKQTRSGDRPDFGEVLTGSGPVGLTIPRIGVRVTQFVGLGLADNGEIEVPKNADTPGWFTPGPSPGQLGPAVIAGHVDSATGPAVFYRLAELRPGDRIKVHRRDGSSPTFIVDRVVSFDKSAFPTRSVYGPTRRPELRLITCGGQFDEQTGYLRNTVVFAHLV